MKRENNEREIFRELKSSPTGEIVSGEHLAAERLLSAPLSQAFRSEPRYVWICALVCQCV